MSDTNNSYAAAGRLDATPPSVIVTDEVAETRDRLAGRDVKFAHVLEQHDQTEADFAANVEAIATGTMSPELIAKHEAIDATRFDPVPEPIAPEVDPTEASEAAWDKMTTEEAAAKFGPNEAGAVAIDQHVAVEPIRLEPPTTMTPLGPMAA